MLSDDSPSESRIVEPTAVGRPGLKMLVVGGIFAVLGSFLGSTAVILVFRGAIGGAGGSVWRRSGTIELMNSSGRRIMALGETVDGSAALLMYDADGSERLSCGIVEGVGPFIRMKDDFGAVQMISYVGVEGSGIEFGQESDGGRVRIEAGRGHDCMVEISDISGGSNVVLGIDGKGKPGFYLRGPKQSRRIDLALSDEGVAVLGLRDGKETPSLWLSVNEEGRAELNVGTDGVSEQFRVSR